MRRDRLVFSRQNAAYACQVPRQNLHHIFSGVHLGYLIIFGATFGVLDRNFLQSHVFVLL